MENYHETFIEGRIRMEKLASESEERNLLLGAGTGAIGGGALLAGKNVKRLTGMEPVYHGTGKENVQGILSEGLKASRAGEGVSTQRANLREQLGDEAVDGKTYLGKIKGISRGYANQAGLKTQGVSSGLPQDLFADPTKSLGEKVRVF